jgi:hypothetical protein
MKFPTLTGAIGRHCGLLIQTTGNWVVVILYVQAQERMKSSWDYVEISPSLIPRLNFVPNWLEVYVIYLDHRYIRSYLSLPDQDSLCAKNYVFDLMT